jgi:molybdopterin converting factor small subunit
MPIRVEFFGIPRQRAGVANTDVQAASLGEALYLLGARFPHLREACLDGRSLRAGYLANLNGQRFVSDPATPLQQGDALLILGADSGG